MLSNSYSTVVTGALPTYTFGSSTGGGFLDTQQSNDIYHTSTSTTYVSTSTSQTLATAAAQSGTDWNSLQYIYTVAGSYTYSGANPTGYVWGYNYGFSLPSDAVILGVVFYMSHATTVASSYKDANIYLRDNNGAAVGTNHADTGTYWSTTLELWYTYGSSVDDWSAGLTPSIVNSGNFGVEVSASRGATASIAYVKQFYLTIYYKVYAKIDLYYSSQFVAASRDYVSALSWGAEGKTSSPNVEIYIWNWGTSAWDDTTQYWTTVEATKTASVTINSYMDSQGNLRMRFSVYAISTTFTISADYLYWSVTWRTPLAVPTLMNPSNNSIVTARPKLEWNAIQLNNGNPYWYHLQVSTVIGFESTILNVTTENSWYNVTVDIAIGLKYWRVRGIAANSSIGSYSGIFRFTVDNVGPPAPTLMNPGNASVAYTLSPVLEWGSVSDSLSPPTSYHIQLATTKTFSTMVWVNETTSNTWWNVTVQLSTSYTYYWRVCALDSLGNIGSWSGVYQFTVSSQPGVDVTLYLSYYGLDGWPLSFGSPKTFINGSRYSNTPMVLAAFLNKRMNLTSTDYFNNIVFQKTNYLLNSSVTWLDVQLQLVSTVLRAYDLSQVEIWGNVTWSDKFSTFTNGVGWQISADAPGYTVGIDNGRLKLTTAAGASHYVYVYTVGSYATKSTVTVWWKTDSVAWGSMAITGKNTGFTDYWSIISSGNLELWSRVSGVWGWRDTFGTYAANTWYRLVIVTDSDSVDVSLYNSDGSLNDVSTGAFDVQTTNWKFALANSYSNLHSTWFDLFILQGGMGYSKTLAFDGSADTLLTPQSYVFNGTAWNGAIRFQTSATISVSLNRVVQLCNIPLIITSIGYSTSDTQYSYSVSCNKGSPPTWIKIFDNNSLILATTYSLSGTWAKSTIYGLHSLILEVGDDAGYAFNFTNSYFVNYRYITFQFYSTVDGLGISDAVDLFQIYVNGSRVWGLSNYATTGSHVFLQVFDYYMNSFYSGVLSYSSVIQVGLGYYQATFANNGDNNIILNSTSDAYALNMTQTGTILIYNFGYQSDTVGTMEFWFNPFSYSGLPTLFSYFKDGNNFLGGFITGVGSIALETNFGGTYYVYQVSAAGVVQLNQWSYIVLTENGTHFISYVNGVAQTPVALKVWLANVTASPSIPFGIAGQHWCYGAFALFRYYSGRVLSSSEVQFNYIHKVPQSQTNLKIWLPLNEGTGAWAYDISGNSKNGQIYPNAVWVNQVNAAFVPVKPIPVAAQSSTTIRMIAKSYTLIGYGIRTNNALIQFTSTTIMVPSSNNVYTFHDQQSAMAFIKYVNANDPNLAAIQPISFNTKYYLPSVGAWRWLSPYSPSVIMLLNEAVNFTVYDNLGSIVVSNQQYTYNETIQIPVTVMQVKVKSYGDNAFGAAMLHRTGTAAGGGQVLLGESDIDVWYIYPGTYRLDVYYSFVVANGYVVPLQLWINQTYDITPANYPLYCAGFLVANASTKNIIDILKDVPSSLSAISIQLSPGGEVFTNVAAAVNKLGNLEQATNVFSGGSMTIVGILAAIIPLMTVIGRIINRLQPSPDPEKLLDAKARKLAQKMMNDYISHGTGPTVTTDSTGTSTHVGPYPAKPRLRRSRR